jgi:hypothetical protein
LHLTLAFKKRKHICENHQKLAFLAAYSRVVEKRKPAIWNAGAPLDAKATVDLQKLDHRS